MAVKIYIYRATRSMQCNTCYRPKAIKKGQVVIRGEGWRTSGNMCQDCLRRNLKGLNWRVYNDNYKDANMDCNFDRDAPFNSIPVQQIR